MSPQEAIRAAARRFTEAGVPDPVYDAAALLAHLTGREPLLLRTDRDTVLSPETLDAYRELTDRRAQRIPLQHLLGSAWFFDREWLVTPDVLIPRWETELLVRRALSHPSDAPIADIGTGSGCLAVTLALETHCPVFAVDISPAALAVAQKNAARQQASNRITFLQGDGLSAFRNQARFGRIVSNPPYIPTDECRRLQPEVLRDPLLALDGGPDGLDILRALIADAPGALVKGGWLLLEIGSDQAAQVVDLMRAQPLFGEPHVFQDDAGLDRVVEVQKVSTDVGETL